MNRQQFIAALIACFAASGAMAQTDRSEVKKNIAQIKKSSSYIYADVTAPTAEEARLAAEESLYAKINEWAATKKKLQGAENFIINNKSVDYQTLSTTRGNMYQAVVYVKKSDIQKADNTDIIENTNPVPVADASKAAEKVPAAEVEEIDAIQSVYPAIVKKIAMLKTYDELVKAIQTGKGNGSIVSYARYTREQTGAEAYYFAVYDKSGMVVALLSPGTSRTNVMTGDTDSLDNYKGCGAIIFKTK